MASVDFRSDGFDGAHRRRVGDFVPEGAHSDAAHGMEGEDGRPLMGRVARMVNYVGAVVSVGLIFGLAVWGVKLVTRDVSGVPVIRAMVGEARIVPDDPGGKLTEYVGMAVNVVPGGMATGAQSDEVAIAPQGTTLADEDAPMGEFGATAMIPGILSDSDPLADANDPVIALQDSEIAARRAEEEAAAAEAAALASKLEAEAAAAVTEDPALAESSDTASNEAVTSLDGAPVDATSISAALAEAQAHMPENETDLVAEPGAALAASPRPQSRPARRSVPVQQTAQAPAPTPAPAAAEIRPQPAVADASPASRPSTRPAAAVAPAPQQASTPAPAVASGGSVVQIGAFDSDAIAQSEWNRISGKSGGLFAGKGQIIQKHESNGRTFYRLRVAGFGSNSEAQEFCGKLKAAGTDCVALKVN